MSAGLLPWPKAKFFTPKTNYPLAGGKVYSYQAGTSTPLATFSDPAGLIPNTNPVVLDANGEAPIYLGTGSYYKIRVTDASDVTLSGYPVDNISTSLTEIDKLRNDLANEVNDDLGASLVGYADPVAPAYLKTVSDIINGLEVSMARFVAPSKLAGIMARTNTDDLTNNFRDAVNAGAYHLNIPRGLWNISGQITINSYFKISGEGRYLTIVRTSSPTANVFVSATAEEFELSDLEIMSSVARTGGSYVAIDPASGSQFGTYIHQVIFNSPYVGIDFVDASSWEVSRCYFPLYVAQAISVRNVAIPDSGDSLITDCTFDAGAATGVAVSQQSSGGLRILSNKFLRGNYHYLGQFNSGSGNNTSIVLISDNSSEWASVINFAISSSNNTKFANAVISNNQISVLAGATGIAVTDPGYDFFNSLNVGGNSIALGASSKGIDVESGSRIIIMPNLFIDNGTNATGIQMGANVDDAIVYPQSMPAIDIPYAGDFSKTIFSPGRRESGTVTATTSTSYGSALFASSVATVTFAQKYAKAPSVDANCNGVNGSVSVLISNITTAKFDYQIVGATSGGSCTANWVASG